jgi:hypothetical protein
MDNLDIKNLQLSYQAIYNDTLCESMQDLGIIGEERAPGVRPYKSGPTQAEVRADAKKSEKAKKDKDKDKEGYGPEEKFKDWKLTSTPSTVNKKGETISQRMDKEAPYKTRPFSPLFTKQGSRTASAVTRATEGPGEPQSVTMPRKKSKPSREIVRRGKQEESVDLYDIVLDHLLDEGYASTIENAEAIMANMSEEWRDSIFEMFGPSLGLNVAATRSQSTQKQGPAVPDRLKNKTATGSAAKPTAKPPTFRPNLATASSAFGKMLQP